MEKLVIIKTLQELQTLKEYIKDKTYIAVDTETTGLEKESEVIGFSVCADVDLAFYVVLCYWGVEQQKLIYLETKEGAKDFLASLIGKSLIMHNATFDCMIINSNFEVQLMPSVHTDTLVLGHLLDENRSNGLKELGALFFGENAYKEQSIMKASVTKNGGSLTRANYELYKADAELIAKYGAKDTILTLKIFYILVEDLYSQGLEKFFYEDESMPLLKGPTYDLNTTGLAVDRQKLAVLKGTLESEILEAKAFIYREIEQHIKTEYPGTSAKNTFNISSSKQLSWLLFYKLGNPFGVLTKEGKNLCKALQIKIPYTLLAKRNFVAFCEQNESLAYYVPGTPKAKKIGKPWHYMSCGKESLLKLADRYKWVAKFLEYSKNKKLLNTYVEGIETKLKYNIIRPSFLQHGTTSGRYSSRAPNFQNLPRDDKRVKACIIARPGNVFVGADYAQLEPRVFASFSKDERLLNCFKDGDDFYSVIGKEVFDKYDCSLKKDDPDSFAKKYPDLRNIAKVVALSATYGTTSFKLAPLIKKTEEDAQEVINSYFDKFPSVHRLMLESHDAAKAEGKVTNLFGRPRRMPEAMDIPKGISHGELPYEYRNLLNLSVNHRIQSTGASIMNRAAITIWNNTRKLAEEDAIWSKVKIVMQVHDELILEGPEELAELISMLLKDAMENTTILPGVNLLAEPKISKDIAGLK